MLVVSLRSHDVDTSKLRSGKSILLGVIALIIAAVISWFITPFVLYDVDNHYPNGDTIVRITSTGEKYHLSSCSYLHSSSINITLEKARQKGYDQCSRCDPPAYISDESYQQSKDTQPLLLLIIGVPLLCAPIALLSFFVVLLFCGFFDLFEKLPDWFMILLYGAAYIPTLIQGLRLMIIW